MVTAIRNLGVEELEPPLAVAVHDFCGHPFQVQLSRELARRGHRVLHLHCPTYVSGKGALARRVDDPPSLEIRGLELPSFRKHSGRRVVQELRYGRRLASALSDFRPDVVLSANAPLLAQSMALGRCRKIGAAFVYWQQDIMSVAVSTFLRERLPVVGRPLGAAFRALERRLLRQSDRVVPISPDWLPVLVDWGVEPVSVRVVENWAPIDDLQSVVSGDAWARGHQLEGKRILLYSGTLGLKHNPSLLRDLALGLRRYDDVTVVVVSEGPGADWLRVTAGEHTLDKLVVLPFQPYEQLAAMHASAYALVVILEPDAGIYSVPSKLLSYLCAGRPILAAVPSTNLAAKVVWRSKAGFVTDPTDGRALVEAAERLLASPRLADELGGRAVAYANHHFDIGRIADVFQAVIAQARNRCRTTTPPFASRVPERSALDG